MQRRLALLLLLALLTACAPAEFQSAPITSPQLPESMLPSATPGNAFASNVVPVYETSVPVVLWNAKARAHQLLPVEPSSGEPVPGYEPIILGVNYYSAVSPDGRTLLIVGYTSDNLRDPVLHKFDLTSWRETLIPLDVTGWVGGLAFSPDGRVAAVGFGESTGTLLILDIEQDRILAQTTPNFEISRLKYTSDGSGLMAYGKVIINRFSENEQTTGFAKVALFDSQTLDLLWSEDVEGVREGIYPLDETAENGGSLHEDPGSAIYLYPGSVFAPDSDSLYIVHADEDKLTTVNFSERTISMVTIQPKLSLLERILLLTSDVAHAKAANGTSRSAVISSDGGTIYTVGWRSEASTSSKGEWEITQTPLGLQVIDAGTGVELFKFATTASGLWITPDDKTLLLHVWGEVSSTDVLDIKTKSLESHFGNAILVPAYRMNGSPLLVSSITDNSGDTRMSAYSMDGVLLGDWLAKNFGAWLTMP